MSRRPDPALQGRAAAPAPPYPPKREQALSAAPCSRSPEQSGSIARAAGANSLTAQEGERRVSVRYDAAALWPVILEEIANGASLGAALRRLDPSPSYAWAKGQLRRNPALKEFYHQAVEDRADRLAEELIELADTPMPDGLDGPAASAWVQRLRVQIDVRKWAASKLKPRAYGDRLDVSVQQTTISIRAALEMAERRVATLIEG